MPVKRLSQSQPQNPAENLLVPAMLKKVMKGIPRCPAKFASMFQGIRSPGAVMKLYQ